MNRFSIERLEWEGEEQDPAITPEEVIDRMGINVVQEAALQECIDSAIEKWEFYTQRPVLPTRFREHHAIPTTNNNGDFLFHLRRSPVTTIEDVFYLDASNESQELEEWTQDLTGVCPLVWFPFVGCSIEHPRPISIEYIAGFTTLPNDVKRGLIALAGHLYFTRDLYLDKSLQGVPLGFCAICAQYQMGVNEW